MKANLNLSVLQEAIKPKLRIDPDILEKALRPEETSTQKSAAKKDQEAFQVAQMDVLEEIRDLLKAHDDKLDVAVNMIAELQQMEILQEENEEASDILEKGLYGMGDFKDVLEIFEGTDVYADVLERLAQVQRIRADRDKLYAKQQANEPRGYNRYGLNETGAVEESDFDKLYAEEERVCAEIKELQAKLFEDAAKNLRKSKDGDDLKKALDLKAEIEKLGSVEDVEKDANDLPEDLAELLKGMETDAPEAPAATEDDDDEKDEDDLKKALDLIGDQPEIHCAEGSDLHDLLKASGGHKYLRKYKTSSGKWAYVYAKQNDKGQDSYSASSFKLDKISAGDKFNMGGGNFVKIDKIDGNMVSFTGTDGKKQTLSAKAFGDRLLSGHKKALTNAAKAGVKKREQALAKAKEKNKPELVKKAQAELKSFQDKHKKLLTEKKEGKSLKEAFKQKQAGHKRGR